MDMADFSDAKKDTEFKDAKKECLIELIDVLEEADAPDTIVNDKVLTETFKMIQVNLFRTFTNKSKSSLADDFQPTRRRRRSTRMRMNPTLRRRGRTFNLSTNSC